MSKRYQSRVERIKELLARAHKHPPRSSYRAALLREVQALMTKQLRAENRAEKRKAAA